MKNKNLKKILSLLFVLVIGFSAMTIPASAETLTTSSSTTRVSGTHQFFDTVSATLTATDGINRVSCDLIANTNEVMDEIGFSSLTLYMYDEELEEWVYYGSWMSQYMSNTNSFYKRASKIGQNGAMYQMEVTFYATKYGTLFNETDEITILSNIVTVP